MNIRTITVFTFLLILATHRLEATTWIVATDGSGDFTEIQPAVDAASDGDIILVRDGTYKGVVVSKPVSIVGTGQGRVFINQISDTDMDAVAVRSVSNGVVGLASFTAGVPATPLSVQDSAGTVIAHDLGLGRGMLFFVVVDSNVFLGQRFLTGGASGYSWSEGPTAIASSVNVFSLTQTTFQGLDGYPSDDSSNGVDGESGFGINGSGAYFLAHLSAKGGRGGDGGYFDIFCVPYPAGAGGHGLEATGGQVLIGGFPEDLFRGNGGGRGEYEPQCYDTSAGGDGGHGIYHTGGGSTQYASVTPTGGQGGGGNPPGDDGKPTEGNVTAIAALPTSKMLGDSALGSTFRFAFYGPQGDQLIMILSGTVGYLRPFGIEGFPLFAVPGGFFFTIPLGSFDATGTREVPLSVPFDPNLRGGAVFAQGVVTSPTGAHKPQLTNVSFAIIKEP
jgi:hypothetical protein